MAYKQSPANVLKGQMTNKAVGLAHGNSMAMQTDPKGGVTVTAKKKKPKSKEELQQLIKSQGQYDRTRSREVLPELAEIDSLRMVAGGNRAGAQELYGEEFKAENAPRLPNTVTREKRKELYKQAKDIQGPRPSL
jgi:hypothetical protein